MASIRPEGERARDQGPFITKGFVARRAEL